MSIDPFETGHWDRWCEVLLFWYFLFVIWDRCWKLTSSMFKRKDGAYWQTRWSWHGRTEEHKNTNNWLVVWIIFYFIFGIIIPTEELIFFRGVGIPPTRRWSAPVPRVSGDIGYRISIAPTDDATRWGNYSKYLALQLQDLQMAAMEHRHK